MSPRQKVIISVVFALVLIAALSVLVFVPPAPTAVGDDGWKGGMVGGLIGGIVGQLLAQRQRRRTGSTPPPISGVSRI